MKKKSEFNPTLFHKFYFIRKGLFKAIKKYSPYMQGRMMDFGCGSKPYQSLFNVNEYIGVDYNGEGHSHNNEQIDVFYNGKKLPFPNNHFDSVFSSEVFEHIFNLEEIIPEIHRTMKQEAKILFTCPFVWNEHEVPNDYARYTQFALRYLLEKNGFEVLIMDKSGNAITTIFQLFQLFYVPQFLAVFFNLAGIFFSKILPNKKSLYLNNIIVAKKL